MNKTLKHHILPIISGVLSLLVLTDIHAFTNIPKIIVACIGLMSTILFFKQSNYFFICMKLWIIALIPLITWSSKTGSIGDIPIWDVFPIFSFNFSLGLGFSKGTISFGVSVLPLFLFILYRILLANSIVGKKVYISKFKIASKLADALPIKGLISKSLNIEDEDYWYLINLETPLLFENNPYPAVIVRDKEGKVFKPGKGKISYMLLVDQPELINNKKLKKKDYPFIDWVIVTLK